MDKTKKEFSMTAMELLEKLKHIAKERYQFPVENIQNYDDLSFIKTDSEKLTFLREICLNFGIKIRPENYSFSSSQNNSSRVLKI